MVCIVLDTLVCLLCSAEEGSIIYPAPLAQLNKVKIFGGSFRLQPLCAKSILYLDLV